MSNSFNARPWSVCGCSLRILLPALPILLLVGCTTPQPRPGPPFDGSARWGLSIAQPLIAGFAADAQLYQILGAQIYRDGRLPSNTGDWSYVAWSPSLQQVFQVTVKYDSTTSTSTRAANTAPGASHQPIPTGWVNSTDVFATVAPHLVNGVEYAQLAVLNVASYPQAPNQPVWGLNFNTGPNQLVKWDGTYLGTQ